MTASSSIDEAFLDALVPAAPLGARRGRLCSACLAVLAVDGVAIVLVPEVAHRELVCSSHDTVERLEELQLALGEGPGVHAFDTGGPVLVADAAADDGTRWPMFAEALPLTWLGGMFAFPLQLGAIRLGVMDLYRYRVGSLTRHELAGALRVAEIITGTLLASTAPDLGPLGLEQLLGQASSSREINQATGMILVQLEVTAEEAYVRLRSFAFAQNRRLGDVARDVVARRLRFGADDP